MPMVKTHDPLCGSLVLALLPYHECRIGNPVIPTVSAGPKTACSGAVTLTCSPELFPFRSPCDRPSNRPMNARADRGQTASRRRAMTEHDSPSRPAEQWMSYAELAERLSISADGARTRAKRAGWKVQLGNDARARVLVPIAEVPERLPEQMPEQSEHAPEHRAGLLAELRRAHAERLAELTARAERAEQQAEQARAGAEQAQALLAQVQVSLARAEERTKAAEAVARGDVEAARRTAEETIAAQAELVAELRRQIERLSRPWWRRLFG